MRDYKSHPNYKRWIAAMVDDIRKAVGCQQSIPSVLLPTKPTVKVAPKPVSNPVVASIRELIDPDNPKCAFYGYIGNRPTVLYGLGIIREALETGKCNCILTLEGRGSVGKSFYARCFTKALQRKLIACPGTKITGKADEIGRALIVGCQKEGITLTPYRKVGNHLVYKLPKEAVLFFDEAQGIVGAAQESLLTMFEAKDRVLSLPTADFECGDVAIVIATTNLGGWGAALKTRIERLELLPHNLDEVAKIVRQNVILTPEQAREIVEYVSISRVANNFAEAVIRTAKQFECSIEEAIPKTAEIRGFNRGGTPSRVLDCLLLLANSQPQGMSKTDLCASLCVDVQNFESDILPHLLKNERHGALISKTNRHKITHEGIAELMKHGLLE